MTGRGSVSVGQRRGLVLAARMAFSLLRLFVALLERFTALCIAHSVFVDSFSPANAPRGAQCHGSVLLLPECLEWPEGRVKEGR